jgi:hypothetical protein
MKYPFGLALILIAGLDGRFAAIAPDRPRFVSVSAGADHVCALTDDISFLTVLPRAWHTCGLSSTHEVFCWGGDLDDRLPA